MLRNCLLGIFVAAALSGCRNPAPLAEAPKIATVKADNLMMASPFSSAEEMCADNMYKLEELLLMYAAVHHELPPSLDKLVPLSNKPITISCPASTKYIYVPNGLVAEGDARVLILYDPEPVHKGKRNAIILTPGKDGNAPFLDVIMITDEVLKAFHTPPTAKP